MSEHIQDQWSGADISFYAVTIGHCLWFPQKLLYNMVWIFGQLVYTKCLLVCFEFGAWKSFSEYVNSLLLNWNVLNI